MVEMEQLKHWKVPVPLTGNAYFYGRTDCLEENTEILIFENNGLIKKKLKDLPENFNVLSYDFNKKDRKKIIPTNATKIYSGEKELYEIEFINGTKVLASANHKFFDKNGNEIKVKDITSGTILLKKNCFMKGEQNVAKRIDVRKKQSIRNTGKGNPMYGRPRTKELIEQGFKVLRLWENEITVMDINDFNRRIKNV